jgi:ferredoxin/flavodoxin---NADP+ reductase
MSDDIRDITIIGGGPTGLFGAFYAGVRQASCRIIDSLPELGGQLTALYPEKDIYDVGGFPRILAKDLARNLIEQGTQFGCDVVLDEDVREVKKEGDVFRLVGRAREYLTKTIVIAGGKGAFEPNHLKVPGYQELLHKGVQYSVKDPETYRSKRVLIVGAGDSALDWALILKDKCSAVTVIHRSDKFRAHEASVVALEDARVTGRVDVRTFHEVRAIHGNGQVEGVTIFDNRTDADTRVDVDAVLTFLGFKPDLGPIKSWGLTVNKNRIVVNQLMETNIPGIYGAGDVVEYEGKIELIATGFAEATIAVNNAVHHINPTARVNPGHSTNLAIFKDK